MYVFLVKVRLQLVFGVGIRVADTQLLTQGIGISQMLMEVVVVTSWLPLDLLII
jgi:hypothetical protein